MKEETLEPGVERLWWRGEEYGIPAEETAWSRVGTLLIAQSVG